MKVVGTELPEVRIVVPRRHGDARGFLSEVYRRERLLEAGIDLEVVQENHSRSTRGILRGLHFQRPPRAQAKLVRVVRGRVFDVAVDVRRGSPTFGRWVGEVLDDEEGRQLYVPPGFAHGFVTLSDVADVSYLLDEVYAPETEGGLRWDDPEVGIEWPLGPGEVTLADRDRGWPDLAGLEPLGIGGKTA